MPYAIVHRANIYLFNVAIETEKDLKYVQS